MTSTGADDDLTRQLRQALQGAEPNTAQELLGLVYAELRRLAHDRLARLGPGQTLQATALVHEAWLRLAGRGDPGWEGRAHFFGAAAQAMRNILVDQARRKASVRHGHGMRRVEPPMLAATRNGAAPEEVLTLHEALEQLEGLDPRKARLVGLRFFTGLSMQEVADMLGIGLTTAEREWRFARAWLQQRMRE